VTAVVHRKYNRFTANRRTFLTRVTSHHSPL